jgi:hypothetical protein
MGIKPSTPCPGPLPAIILLSALMASKVAGISFVRSLKFIQSASETFRPFSIEEGTVHQSGHKEMRMRVLHMQCLRMRNGPELRYYVIVEVSESPRIFSFRAGFHPDLYTHPPAALERCV